MGELLTSGVSKSAHVIRELGADLPPVAGDATELRQVVMNLVTNASEALEDGEGTIWLRTGVRMVDEATLSDAYVHDRASPGPHVFLEVEDTGCGMDEATCASIFDPFFTTKFAGRGLGLAALLGIVRGHRGLIQLESQPRKGTTFTVLLPVAKSKVEPEPDAQIRASHEVRSDKQTILVVDDEATVRDLVAMTLCEAGFDVITAATGAEALELHAAKASQISLILLDLTMPHMNGEQTLRALREHDKYVRVVLSSGYAEEEAMRRVVGHDVTGFLQKPYRATELIARIKRALRT